MFVMANHGVSHLGPILTQNWNTPEKIEELLSFENLQSLGPKVKRNKTKSI